MSEADALAGRLVFGGDGLGGGPLKVDGQILARNGDVVLIAPNVHVGSQALRHCFDRWHEQLDRIPFGDYSGGNKTMIDIATINCATTNVDLQANNDIRFSAPVFMDYVGTRLSARADRTITVDASITTRAGRSS